MQNFTYKSLDARSFLEKVIAREEAYTSKDFDSLSFEEKCEYLSSYNSISHPSLTDKCFARRRFLELKPELERLAAEGDAFGLCYMGLLSTAKDIDQSTALEYLKRSAELDYTIGGAAYLKRKRIHGIEHDDYKIALNAVDYYYTVEDDEKRLLGILACYRAFALFHGDGSADKAILEARYGLADIGYAPAYFMLARHCADRAKSATSPEEREDALSEMHFWYTVEYLVMSYFASAGSIRSYDRVAQMLYEGIGCNPDVDRVNALDVAYIRAIGAHLSPEGLAEVEQERASCAEQRPMCADVLRAFLDSDTAALYRAISRANLAGDRPAVVHARFAVSHAAFMDRRLCRTASEA